MNPPIWRCYEHGMYVRGVEPPQPRGTLLYIHGLGESGLCFERLLERPELADWRHIVPDLLGYGRSLWSDEPLTLEGHADHLAGWLRDRGEEPVVVVGHSMGSVCGLLLCERYPEGVLAFVDVEGNKSRADCAFSGPAAADAYPEFFQRGFEVLLQRVYGEGRESAAERGYYVSLRLCDPNAFHENSRELVAASSDGDLAARLAALPHPVHFIAGVPNGSSRDSLDALEAAGIPWIGVKPSGHWPFIDQPEGFCAALSTFLDTL